MFYKIDGGDGDQQFFSEELLLERTDTDWFPGRVKRGEAQLYRIVKGKFIDKYLIVTSRVHSSIDEQMSSRGIASVVVQIVNNPTKSFDGSDRDAFPFGMSVLEKV